MFLPQNPKKTGLQLLGEAKNVGKFGGLRKKIDEVTILELEKCGKLEQCKILNFPKVTDYRGNLSFIEENSQVPFEIKRVYYLYDVPSGATRGGHAHKSFRADGYRVKRQLRRYFGRRSQES